MRKTLFKVFPFLFSLILLELNASAQQNHFIYIQADDKQPFSAEVNGKTYNSTGIGYLIIPKLKDGEYQLRLSSPSNQFPEQTFNCAVDNRDVGFALKNFGDKGWGLFNLQTFEIITAGGQVKSVKQTDEIKRDTVKPNPFGDMLSQVVNDTNLTKAVTPAVIEKAKESIDTIKTNLPQEVSTQPDNVVVENNNAEQAASTKGVIKAYEQFSDSGRNVVFVDFNSAGSDTIDVFIPADLYKNVKADESNVIEQEQSNPDTANKDIAKDENTGTIKNSETTNIDTATDKLFTNPFYEKPAEEKEVTTEPVQSNAAEGMYKSACEKMLSDNDFDKMKRKMFTESTDEKMIAAAKKYSSGKCLTTQQIKTLGGLFLSDEGRYNLFDALYNYAYDYGNYTSLESQLIDPYYKKRFQAMLK